MRLDRVRPGQRRTVAAIVDRLLPSAPQLPAEARRRVAEASTRFVVVEIESIPPFLRLPYLLAVVGFEWVAVLRYGRPFSRLAAEAQRAYLALWSDFPIGTPRDFVKLIRGCALLAYFDHPEVRAALERGRRAADEPVRLAAE